MADYHHNRIGTQETGDAEVEGDQQQAWFRDMWEGKQQTEAEQAEVETSKQAEQEEADAAQQEDDDDDDFGDDFDDFAEEGGDDDDFGDFDEADADADEGVVESAPEAPSIPSSLSGLVSSQQNQLSFFQSVPITSKLTYL